MTLDKPTLRRQFLARRKELTLEQWQSRSAVVVARIQAHCHALTPRCVALYAPIASRREVDVSPLDAWFRGRGVNVAYPIMAAGARGFAAVTADTLSAFGGFLQPHPTSLLLQPGELDLLVVPALAVTPSGYRLGYGAGFYDEQVRKFCPPARSLCVAFAEQLVSELPVESHDVACDTVVTDG